MTEPRGILDYLKKLPARAAKPKKHTDEKMKAKRRRQITDGQLRAQNGLERGSDD